MHGIAPSPLVLTFLRAQVRAAFDTPVAQSAGIRNYHKGYGTTGLCALDKSTRGGGTSLRRLQRGDSLCSRGLLNETCLLKPRIAQQNFDGLRSSTQQGLSISQRNFSTTRRFQAWNVFKSAKTRRLAAPGSPDDHPAGPSGFGSSLGRMTRATNELKMRCTELDEHGNVTLVSGEFKKSELIAKVSSPTILTCQVVSQRASLTVNSMVSSLVTSGKSTPLSSPISSSAPPPF